MATILIADDDPFIRRILADRMKRLGHDVMQAADGAEALSMVAGVDVMLLDIQMPRMDGIAVVDSLSTVEESPAIIMITAHGDVENAVHAMKAGAWDFVRKPFDGAEIERRVSRALEKRRLERRASSLQSEATARHMWIRGPNAAMARIADTLERIAPSEVTVLLTGETGVGKEVLARALHRQSKRASGPFVAINCASLRGELLESELFGHERGAFTGANKTRLGRLQTAAGGTLFMDEIGEMSPDLQARLLRVLQEREYERVGGDRTLKADVRVVAATNRDLPARIAAGQFREDLYYRLNVISLEIPPLRERRDDILVLIANFFEKGARRIGRDVPRLSAEAQDALVGYHWPGNVRELANAVERFVLLCGPIVELEDLPREITQTQPAKAAVSTPDAASPAPLLSYSPVSSGVPSSLFELPYTEALDAARKLILQTALTRTGGHQTRAAKLLGITQPYISRMIRKLNLKTE